MFCKTSVSQDVKLICYCRYLLAHFLMDHTEINSMCDDVCNSNFNPKEKFYCICRSSDSYGFMIECTFCKEWYHGDCIGVTIKASKRIDIFCCVQCKLNYPDLKTTYKKRSNRRKLKAKRNCKNSAISVCFKGVSSQQLKTLLLVTGEFYYKKLANIHLKLYDIEKELEDLDIKIIKLIDKIQKCKKPENHYVEFMCDENITSIDAGMSKKFSESKLERFYMEVEKEVTTEKIKQNNSKWNIFCNKKITKNSRCWKMKVLCPLHYKNSRRAGEVCGYNLGNENGIVQYCGNKDRTCNHLNWEERERAELDLEKLILFLKFEALKNEKAKIQKQMSRRGFDVSSVMFKYIFGK